MLISGQIIEKALAAGSKSQHQGLFIVCAEAEYVIRFKGDNPFENKSLKAFIGKQVMAEGILIDYLFLANSVREA